MLQNQCKGFFSFDALLSTVPIILMLFFTMNIVSLLSHDAAERIHRQQVFDKLVSIADYTVKIGAVRAADGIRCPNWLDEDAIDDSYAESLRQKADLSSLSISLGSPESGHDFCIYRTIVIGDEKEISRLFVCGE